MYSENGDGHSIFNLNKTKMTSSLGDISLRNTKAFARKEHFRVFVSPSRENILFRKLQQQRYKLRSFMRYSPFALTSRDNIQPDKAIVNLSRCIFIHYFYGLSRISPSGHSRNSVRIVLFIARITIQIDRFGEFIIRLKDANI